MQYIQVRGIVTSKPEDQNSYQGDLWGQLGAMCAIEIMESILGSTALVVNINDNVSSLRQVSIHLEAVT